MRVFPAMRTDRPSGDSVASPPAIDTNFHALRPVGRDYRAKRIVAREISKSRTFRKQPLGNSDRGLGFRTTRGTRSDFVRDGRRRPIVAGRFILRE
jgi:hypothetical protein